MGMTHNGDGDWRGRNVLVLIRDIVPDSYLNLTGTGR